MPGKQNQSVSSVLLNGPEAGLSVVARVLEHRLDCEPTGDFLKGRVRRARNREVPLSVREARWNAFRRRP